MKKILYLLLMLTASFGARAQTTVYASLNAPSNTSGCDQIPVSGGLINAMGSSAMGTAYLQKRQPDNTWTVVSGSQRSVTNGFIFGSWNIVQSGTYRANATLTANGTPLNVQPQQPNGISFTVNYSASPLFNIQGNSSTFPAPINFYPNSPSINLTNQSLYATEYDIDVIKTDANGNTISVVRDGVWTSTLTTLNLISYTSNQILVPGFYKVVMNARNSTCNTIKVRTAFVRTNPFEFTLIAPNNGPAIPRSESSGNVPVVPYYTCGIFSAEVIQGGGLSLSNYTITIERVTPPAAVIASSTFNSTAFPSQPIFFNSTDIANGFFSNNVNNLDNVIFKVTLSINNNAFSLFSYFKFSDDVLFRVAGSAPFNEQTGFKVWPNPASDRLNIQLPQIFSEAGGVEMEVLDVTGKRLLHQPAKGSSVQQIDIRQLPRGTYLLKVNSNRTSEITRFIK